MPNRGVEVKIKGEVDASNSSVTPLAGDAVFTGTATEILNAGTVFVNVVSDVASATDGLSIQQSSDGTNWDHTDDYTVPSGTGKNYSINPHSRYVRVVYTNGSGAQSSFRLQTIIKGNSRPSSHRIQDPISNDDDAELTKAVLTGRDPDGNFENVNSTVDGDLSISDNSSGLAIAKGDVTGTTFVHKFGKTPDFDIADGYVSVWDGANDAGIDQMDYQYSTTADIDSLVSSNAGDSVDIEIQGLDSNWDLTTQTITLNGQTRVALDTDLIRVFRMINVGATDLVGDVSCYVNSSITGGVVDDSADVRAIINNGNNQTLMAIYTIPNGKTGYMRSGFVSAAGAKKTSVHNVRLFARPTGGVFQLKHDTSINLAGTSYIQHLYVDPEVLPAKTDLEVKVNSDEDQAGISAGFDLVLVDD